MNAPTQNARRSPRVAAITSATARPARALRLQIDNIEKARARAAGAEGLVVTCR